MGMLENDPRESRTFHVGPFVVADGIGPRIKEILEDEGAELDSDTRERLELASHQLNEAGTVNPIVLADVAKFMSHRTITKDLLFGVDLARPIFHMILSSELSTLAAYDNFCTNYPDAEKIPGELIESYHPILGRVNNRCLESFCTPEVIAYGRKLAEFHRDVIGPAFHSVGAGNQFIIAQNANVLISMCGIIASSRDN